VINGEMFIPPFDFDSIMLYPFDEYKKTVEDEALLTIEESTADEKGLLFVDWSRSYYSALSDKQITFNDAKLAHEKINFLPHTGTPKPTTNQRLSITDKVTINRAYSCQVVKVKYLQNPIGSDIFVTSTMSVAEVRARAVKAFFQMLAPDDTRYSRFFVALKSKRLERETAGNWGEFITGVIGPDEAPVIIIGAPPMAPFCPILKMLTEAQLPCRNYIEPERRQMMLSFKSYSDSPTTIKELTRGDQGWSLPGLDRPFSLAPGVDTSLAYCCVRCCADGRGWSKCMVFIETDIHCGLKPAPPPPPADELGDLA